MPMDKVEFTRRIAAYLRADLPNLEARDDVAEVLARRLWQYAAPKPPPSFDASLDAELLRSVFTDGDVTFVFTARWDGNSRAYANMVGAHTSPVVEIDIDGRIGGTIAGALRVMTTPTIVAIRSGDVVGRLVGRRGHVELRDWFARGTT